MKGDLVALDPGIQCPGVAVFRDGTLYACAYLKLGTTRGNHAAKVALAAHSILAWLHNVHGIWPVAVAYEWPQIYQDDGPAVANAVIYMAAVDAYVSARLGDVQLLSYLPAEIWHSLPKRKTGSAKESPRGLRVCSRLSVAELAVLPDQHDAVDACGIGLHALGRLGIRRAPYSST